ncbi:MAG: flagellar assembly protein FliX [Alphaproteobacteria bacterium]|nr:flagellar assembly protein FliX [Alphaproteobacteria bacterium]
MEFALDGSNQASGAGAASGVSVAAAIAGILSLQEVDDATASLKLAVRRAETLLDRLDELRHGLLMGALSRAQMGELALLVSQRRDSVEDAKLAELLDEIDLRVQVEIAKYEVESAA